MRRLKALFAIALVGSPIGDVVRMAEIYSPNLQAARASEKAASEGIRVRESAYYPTLDFAVVDSSGFPASSGSLPGFGGLMDSPYRSGWSLGGFTSVTLFDLTRERGVQTAEAGFRSATERSELTRLEIDELVTNLYLDALRDRALRDTWQALATDIERLAEVVKKFVRNGQYSEVTEWLLKYQRTEALQKKQVYETAYASDLRRLEIATGAPAGSVEPTGFDEVQASVARMKAPPGQSPLVLFPKLEAEVSGAFASEQAAQNYPRLEGLASAGAMHDARLVQEQNYSAWIGLTLPIFEGFRISAQEKQARAEAERSADLASQAQLSLADLEIRYREEARARDLEVRGLVDQQQYAREALKLSEYRYRTFVGNLADVRDSLYSYENSATQLSIARVEGLRARLLENLVEGGSF